MVIKRFMFACVLVIFFCQGVYAVAGVTPASYDFNFEPGLEKEIYFNFIFDGGTASELYAQGDLAEYVKISKKKLSGSGSVIVNLKLPSVIEKPGIHRILVGARQSSEGAGVGIVANVQGVIKIRVPYPGKYAELDFTSTNANAGEPVDLVLKVVNRGKESISINPTIDIFDSEKKIEGWMLETRELNPTEKTEFTKRINTEDYGAGNYNTTATVEYGGDKPAIAEFTFRLGELYVEISNTSTSLQKNKIDRFEIEVESFWNEEIEDLFANIQIEKYGISSLTPSINLRPWQISNLVGFIDTNGIEEDTVQAKVTLSYEGKTTSKIVELVLWEEMDYTRYIIIGGLILIIILLIVIILVFWRYRNGFKKR